MSQVKAPKNFMSSFSGSFINNDKQGGTEALREECSCFSECKFRRRSCSAFFLFPGQGCAYLGLQAKAIKLHLALLTSSSYRLFIICSPQNCSFVKLIRDVFIGQFLDQMVEK
jgi:hypothetical protein